jgi:hypothetical protein
MSWLSLAIRNALLENHGLAVGKLGTCELETMYIYNNRYPYNWVLRTEMTRNAGLWPAENQTLHAWAKHMATYVLPKMDGIAAWWNPLYEDCVIKAFANKAHVEKGIEWINPWTDFWLREIPSSCGVAVVSPFAESITTQLDCLNELFPEPLWSSPAPRIFPVKTGCSPIYDGKSPAAWPSGIQNGGWLAAVSDIVEKVMVSGARVALVGCGALSLPIVVALKEKGIVAIHTGGITQCIFGIRGKRWIEDPTIGPLLSSPHWISPQPSETPIHAKTIEGGCYWMPVEKNM